MIFRYRHVRPFGMASTARPWPVPPSRGDHCHRIPISACVKPAGGSRLSTVDGTVSHGSSMRPSSGGPCPPRRGGDRVAGPIVVIVPASRVHPAAGCTRHHPPSSTPAVDHPRPDQMTNPIAGPSTPPPSPRPDREDLRHGFKAPAKAGASSARPGPADSMKPSGPPGSGNAGHSLYEWLPGR